MKRYAVDAEPQDYHMVEAERGDWVKYDDVMHLIEALYVLHKDFAAPPVKYTGVAFINYTLEKAGLPIPRE